MSIASDHDCGHRCCDERTNPHHDHFLAADVCPSSCADAQGQVDLMERLKESIKAATNERQERART